MRALVVGLGLAFALIAAACDETALRGVAVTGQLAIRGATPGTLGGQTVTLFPTLGGAARTALTDGEGRFVFDRVASGDYVVEATISQTQEATRAVPVTVVATDVALPPLEFGGLGSIVGRVQDGTGGLVPAAQVLAGDRPAQTPDAQGAFELQAVPAGPQVIVAYAPGRLAAVSSGLVVTWRGTTDAGLLTLGPATTTQLLTGQVAWPTPGPVPPILVSVDDGKWQTTADATGVFTVTGVTDGVHAIDFFEQTAAVSGAPVPLHNRLPRVLVSSGQAFALGTGVTALPIVPLYRGRRIGEPTDLLGALAPDKRSTIVAMGYGGLTALLDLDGQRTTLSTGGGCGYAVTGAVCESRTLLGGQRAKLARVTFHPIASPAQPVVLSDRALWSRWLPGTDRVLVAEPGTTALLQSYRVVDGSGATAPVTLAGETGEYLSLAISRSSKRVAIGDKLGTTLFDLETGAKLGEKLGGGLPAFAGERAFVGTNGGIFDVESATPLTTEYGGTREGSPDGKYLVAEIGGWSGPSTRLYRVSDGARLMERFGSAHYSWSADGTHAFVLIEHFSHSPASGELLSVDLASGAVQVVASSLYWCTADAARPAIWLCNDKVSEFAIDAASGARVALGTNHSAWFSLSARYVPDGIVVYSRDGAAPYGYGRLDLLKLPSFTVEPIADRASLAASYGTAITENNLADPAGRRIAFPIDYGGALTVVDRAANQTHTIGAPASYYLTDLLFAEGGALISKRSMANPALSDLGGVYITEFQP